ncbi:hypothetical protein BASA62_007791 [Batrachochytrium salamandrivorans]|nr:hypothetical protein BASA62_007791 [Batrachochytrium salamandrivorans]
MRVHIGISLSVLSLSVLAKVIPNDGSHGSLLVRRTVDPDPMDFSWRRNNGDDKQGSSPMDSRSWSKHILDSDERLIQKAIEKVTGAFEGEQANQVISEIKALLTHVLNSIRMFLESYEAISRIIKKPRKVANRLRDIVYKAQLLRNYISFQYYTYYTTLFSKMDTTENRAYVEVTKDYIRQMDSDWDLALELLEKIKGMVNDGMMRLKPVPSRFSSLTSSVKKRLGIKDGPPADHNNRLGDSNR